MTVAYAAPAAPIRNLIMSKRSSTIFKSAARIKKYKGRRLSPRALRMLARRLYNVWAAIPPQMTIIYPYAWPYISAGVCIQRRMSFIIAILRMVRIRDTAADRIAPDATDWRMACRFPAP